MRENSFSQWLLHDLLDQAAQLHGDRPFLIGPPVLSFRETAGETCRLAGWLRSIAVERGSRIAIITRNRAEAILVAFAAARIGAIFTILHNSIKPYGLRPILKECEPVLVVLDETTRHLADHIGPARLLWAGCADPPRGAIPWREAAKAIDGGQFSGPHTPRLQSNESSDPVCLVYTSGSAGIPRGVLLSHDNIRFAAAAIQERLRYRPEDLIGLFLPLSFDYGLYQIFLAAQAGAAVFVGSPENAGPELLTRLASLRISVLPGVPTLFAMLLKLLHRRPCPLPDLRCMTNTGEHLPKESIAAIHEYLPGVEIFVMYGLTECKRVSILLPDDWLTKPDSVGRPLTDTEVFAVDEDGRQLGPRTLGELVVRGRHVALGYWQAGTDTALRFRRASTGDRELYTGDLGWVDEEGFVYLAGRKDYMLKHHGIRVSPLEVERAACSIPGVELAAVIKIAVTDQLHLFVTTTMQSLTAGRVIAGMRELLELHKVPDQVHVVADLPRNSNGKIDRRRLQGEPS